MPTKSSAAQATSTSRSTARSRDAHKDAIALLKADHKEVKELFKDYQKLVDDEAGGNERRALAEKICGMLTAHATVEEELFYPQARAALDEEDLVDEADVEHASAKDLIAQIQASSPDEPLYDAKVKVLGEYIDHHVKEEEGEMFPKIKKTELDLDTLGEELEVRKEELLQELGMSDAVEAAEDSKPARKTAGRTRH